MVAITLVSRAAGGHVAPSFEDNNRYIKLTPLGDRVRLAYTVLFGEVPGASERRTIDANRDGRIDDAEAHAFGQRLATQVAAALDVDVDGRVQPVAWSIVDVGMGTPAVDAGAFSVDLIAYVCLPTVRGKHRVVLRDRFAVPRPGETEVKVEDSPGVSIEHARVGSADDPTYDYRFVGAGGPLEDEGLDLAFTAGDRAAVTADAICARAAEPAGRHGLVIALVVGGVAVIAAVAAWLLRRRHRERRRHG